MSEEAAARRNLSPSVQIAVSLTSTIESRPSTRGMEQATDGLNQGGATPEKSGVGWGSSRGHDGNVRATAGSVELNRGRAEPSSIGGGRRKAPPLHAWSEMGGTRTRRGRAGRRRGEPGRQGEERRGRK